MKPRISISLKSIRLLKEVYSRNNPCLFRIKGKVKIC